MATDVYLQIDGIKGESQDSAHQGWIEVTAAMGCNAAKERDRINRRRPYSGAVRAPHPGALETRRSGLSAPDANVLDGQDHPERQTGVHAR